MSPEEFIIRTNEHLKYIKELYEQAYPDGKYITFCLIDGEWQYNNEYWGQDAGYPVAFPPKQG